jgi:hypothetical protein
MYLESMRVDYHGTKDMVSEDDLRKAADELTQTIDESGLLP